MKKSKNTLPSLEALQRKIDELKPRGDEENSQTDSQKAVLSRATRMGTDLLAGAGVGCVMGYYLDKALGTLPVFFIIFFFLGFAAGLRNIMRNVDKMDDKDN